MISKAERIEAYNFTVKNWATIDSWYKGLKRKLIDEGNLAGLRVMNKSYLLLLNAVKTNPTKHKMKLSASQVHVVRKIVQDLQEALTKELEELNEQFKTDPIEEATVQE